MRYIVKRDPPALLVEFLAAENAEWKPRYSNLDAPTKDAVRSSLVAEQGGLCGYCMGRIAADRTSCHIDHLIPQAHPTLGKANEVNYANLVASCMGEPPEGPKGTPFHCGHSRGSWYDAALFVTPHRPACEDAFRYGTAGTIEPCAGPLQDAASETIERLQLRNTNLVERRRAAIRGILEPEPPDRDEALQLIEALLQPDPRGESTEFCLALVQVVRAYAFQSSA